MTPIRLALALRVSFVAITIAGGVAMFLPWILYAFSSPFPGRLAATLAFTVIVGRELWVSCLRMPKKVAVAPSRDWTAVAVGFAYLGVLFSCLTEIHLRRRGFPALEVSSAGATFYVGGLLMRSAALRHLGKRWSIQLDQADTAGSTLVRSGPYGWIRHPIYLGAMFESVGMALFFGAPAALSIAVLCFCPAELARARFEEHSLLVDLGDAYRAYCREVGGFIPRRLPRR